MNRFRVREIHNVESELDLWVRGERDQGRSDGEILTALLASIPRLLEDQEAEFFDTIPQPEPVVE